jgi:hypothetical protein
MGASQQVVDEILALIQEDGPAQPGVVTATSKALRTEVIGAASITENGQHGGRACLCLLQGDPDVTYTDLETVARQVTEAEFVAVARDLPYAESGTFQ